MRLNGMEISIIRRRDGRYERILTAQNHLPRVFISNYARNRAHLANPDIQRRVRISRSPDRYGRYDAAIMPLAPSRELVERWKLGSLAETAYIRQYWSEVNPHWGEAVSQLRDGDCLLCFCAAGKFCHRYLVADRLRNEGYDVVLVENITASSDRRQVRDRAQVESPPNRI